MDLYEKTLVQKLFYTIFEEDGPDYASSLYPNEEISKGLILTKQPGIASGLLLVLELAKLAGLEAQECVKNGSIIDKGTTLIQLTGRTNLLLQAERPFCNLLMHLSGIATETSRYIEMIKDFPVRLCPTRKTTPGLRYWEKQAVVHGGGNPHRYGLSDGVMLKDNHIAAYKDDLFRLIKVTREHIPHTVKIEVEVDSIDQIEPVIKAGADILMLDNFNQHNIISAVKICRELDQKYSKERYQLGCGRLILEASGGIDIGSVRKYAESGVDIISIGNLTHSVHSLNVSMDLVRL